MEIDYSDWIKRQQDAEPVDPAKDQQNSIDLSNRIIVALESKIKDYKKENSDRELKLHQLKTIYRNSARIICEDCQPNKSNNQWGLARVNMFIHSKKPVKKISLASELKEVQLEEGTYFYNLDNVDISLDWIPSVDMFSRADEDIKKYNLDIEFKSVDDLYLDDPASPLSSYHDID